MTFSLNTDELIDPDARIWHPGIYEGLTAEEALAQVGTCSDGPVQRLARSVKYETYKGHRALDSVPEIYRRAKEME